MIGSGLFKAGLFALHEVLKLDLPADLKLRHHFKKNPQAGRRDRQWIAELVFDVLRQRRRYLHWISGLGGQTERGLALASVARRGYFANEPLESFIKPLALSERDIAWLENLLHSLAAGEEFDAQIKPAVRLSVPDWSYDQLVNDHGESTAVALAKASVQNAGLDLRVNTLKANAAQVIAALAAANIQATAVPWFPEALRVEGKPALDKVPEFEQGWFEVQDAGSQFLAAKVDAKRGQTVVDFCAGAGGKTLALAAQMKNSGQIYAMDISTARLARLRPRLARSGSTNVQPFAIDTERDPKLSRLRGRADRVLVDAPCTGSGTWRRNPDLKWRIDEKAFRQLQDQQGSILAAASLLVRPGGWLIYSTCSLYRPENQAVIERFLASDAGQGFVPDPAEPTGRQLLPHEVDADGFYVCVMRLNAKEAKANSM
jgi:16S rRNA (cytosine967-C5)-methyltransferase